jgi:hypothetical protein
LYVLLDSLDRLVIVVCILFYFIRICHVKSRETA